MAQDDSVLRGRRILVGVSGGIAAYKAAELVRLLVKAGAEVRVVLTRAGAEFITPLTLQTLSKHPVATELFDLTQEATVGHIELADRAELLCVAPATANLMAQLAHGLAGDLLSTVALACTAPLLLAPAMNVNMWRHAAVQANAALLKQRRAHVLGPDEGDLACGWVGAGRMAEPADIAAACAHLLGGGDLAGVRVLVTGGPTHEAIDPVRFVGNRATGKMGFQVAARAAARGARVTLVAGPSSLPTPPRVDRVDVVSAADMHREVAARAGEQGIIVMAAAVADHRPRNPAPEKLKKEALGAAPVIQLEATVDILAELGRTRRGKRPVLVGFAAETGDLERKARDKLARKGCDLLVANDVTEAGAGFGTDTNRVLLLDRGGALEQLPLLGKDEVADRLLDRAAAMLRSPEVPA